MKRWALAFVLAVTGGCLSDRQADSIAKGIFEKVVFDSQVEIRGNMAFSRADFRLSLYSVAGNQKLNLTVTYNGSFKLNGAYSNLISAAESIPEQYMRVGLYSANQAVQYIENGTINSAVTIQCDQGESALAKVRADLTNWSFGTNEVDYCKNTLAVRDGTNVTDMLPERKNLTREWVPLDWASWPIWYGQLDQELHLEETFGHPAAMRTP